MLTGVPKERAPEARQVSGPRLDFQVAGFSEPYFYAWVLAFPANKFFAIHQFEKKLTLSAWFSSQPMMDFPRFSACSLISLRSITGAAIPVAVMNWL